MKIEKPVAMGDGSQALSSGVGTRNSELDLAGLGCQLKMSLLPLGAILLMIVFPVGLLNSCNSRESSLLRRLERGREIGR